MQIKITPMFKCKCGKLHIGTLISRISICICGVNLHEYFWNLVNGIEKQ